MAKFKFFSENRRKLMLKGKREENKNERMMREWRRRQLFMRMRQKNFKNCPCIFIF